MSTDFKEKTQFHEVQFFNESKQIRTVKYLTSHKEEKRSINVCDLINHVERSTNYNQILFDFFMQCGHADKLSLTILSGYLEKKSLINFIRYYNELEIYLRKRDFFVELTELGFLNIRLMSKFNSTGYLELTFNKNGKVDYLTLDKEFDPREKKTFVMRGYIETSSILRKSYKFNRLLCLLNHMDLESKEFRLNLIE